MVLMSCDVERSQVVKQLPERRDESRRGTQECVRHALGQAESIGLASLRKLNGIGLPACLTIKLMKLSVLLITAALAQAQNGTLLEVSTKGGRQFYSLPDEKGIVAAAHQNLVADPSHVELLLKLAAAES